MDIIKGRQYVIACAIVIATWVVPEQATGQAGPKVADHYDTYFTNKALRVDLVHNASKDRELFGLQGVVKEPVWPGTRVHLIDPTGYGQYRFRVMDKATGVEVFSQGYSTLLGEWLFTDEASLGLTRSMLESFRFPFPRAPVVLVLETRNEKGEFVTLQSMDIDTTAYNLRTEHPYEFSVVNLHDCGKDASNAVDFVIVPDGYTVRDRDKMLIDSQRFAEVLLENEPFKGYLEFISVRLVEAFSRESGVDEPRKGIFRNTILSTTFDTFNSPRYLTTDNMKRLRQIAALAPYDSILVMANTNRYGGGGIFNSYSIFPSDNEYDEYVMVHEIGHGFGGLADEYYDSSTGYNEEIFYKVGVEPWEPNLTFQTDPERIKWKKYLTPGVPLPTPDEEKYSGVVGLFEGGGYRAKGIFRPTRDSKMFRKALSEFGPVNEAAIERMIRYYIGEPL